MTILKKTKNKTILIAEGFPAAKKIMIDIFKLLGYNFISADNGYEVILNLKNKNIDLVLLDLELPQYNGFETIEHIRRNLEYPQNTIPVIAMSNPDFLEDFDETYKEEGFDALIIKPFSLNDLDKTIEEVLLKTSSSKTIKDSKL